MAETELYRPSNGTEGDIFCGQFCTRCDRDKDEDDPCSILTATLIYGVDEPDYPPQWVRDVGPWPGNPRCTAFVPRGTPSIEFPTLIDDPRQIGLAL